MSGGASDLTRIRPPDDAPSELPDALTAAGEQQLEDDLERAVQISSQSPTTRSIHANERLIAVFQADINRLQTQADTRQEELDELRPKYAALAQYIKMDKGISVIASVATLIGGGLISYASVVADDTWKKIDSIAGWGFLSIGCLVLLFVHIFGLPGKFTRTHRGI